MDGWSPTYRAGRVKVIGRLINLTPPEKKSKQRLLDASAEDTLDHSLSVQAIILESSSPRRDASLNPEPLSKEWLLKERICVTRNRLLPSFFLEGSRQLKQF